MDDSNQHNSNDYHQMGRRGHQKNYCWPGTYHITVSVEDRRQQPLGRIAGDISKSDGTPEAPHVVLSAIGQMVEQELTTSITQNYSMIEVQDYVIMPDHLHCIVVVHSTIVSKNGRMTHLGQVIAGFKKGCNRRYWELQGMSTDTPLSWQGKPANARNTTQAAQSQAVQTEHSRSAVHPQSYKVPSNGTTGRPPLFASGYVDVMPLREGQLEQQRQYIHNNPRSRLLRMQNRSTLTPQRGGIDTALTLPALQRYLQQVCGDRFFNAETWAHIQQRLLPQNGRVTCDSYGDRRLLTAKLLPVVCHRDDIKRGLFAKQKERCLAAAAQGVVLVSARIAKGEQDIINAAISAGHSVITIEDNGLPELYHPSERRMSLCQDQKLLIVTPWQYTYRPANEQITMAECKTMNCVAQALCHTKDDWWKKAINETK